MNDPSRTLPDRPLRVAQVGCGAWGANVLHELAAHPRVELVIVADPRAAARDRAREIAPGVRVTSTIDDIADARAHAAVIVSPGPLHAEHAAFALAHDLHVFVEKPLATSSVDARRLCAMARDRARVGMVGHLLHHHPAARAMVELLHGGQLGAPLYVRCDRGSIAGSREVDGSILWSLAPHDLSMIRAIGRSALRVSRVDVLRTGSSGQPVEAELHVETAGGLRARVLLSRVADRKTRRIHVECELGSVTFDDVVSLSKVVASRRGGEQRVEPVGYDQRISPLAAELDAFVRAVLDGEPARADFEEGAEIVAAIESAEALSRAGESASARPYADQS